MLPNFICPGAQKAGTTTLFEILRQHPQIHIPPCKEVKFFYESEKYSRGMPWYVDQFHVDTDSIKAVGDMTPEYMFFEEVPGRIHDSLGHDVKFIFCLRNPLQRAYSHYWMNVRRGLESLSFEEAIELEAERLNLGKFERAAFSYVGRGFYAEQISRFLEHYPPKAMKFVLFEELITRPGGVAAEILRFLNLDEAEGIDYSIHANPARMPRSRRLTTVIDRPPMRASYFAKALIPSRKMRVRLRNLLRSLNSRSIKKPPIKERTRDLLLSTYESDIDRLQAIIALDLAAWISGQENPKPS